MFDRIGSIDAEFTVILVGPRAWPEPMDGKATPGS